MRQRACATPLPDTLLSIFDADISSFTAFDAADYARSRRRRRRR
jgi:hypothetical protein